MHNKFGNSPALMRNLVIALFILAAGFALYFHNKANLTPEIRHHKIDIPYAGSIKQGLRIAFVTDTHSADTPQAYENLKTLMASVSAARPDIILLGGDYSMASHTINDIT